MRLGRLVVHEMLIRFSADYSVSGGNPYAYLEDRFRRMMRRLLEASGVALRPKQGTFRRPGYHEQKKGQSLDLIKTPNVRTAGN